MPNTTRRRNSARFLRCVQEIREWEDKKLPLGQSRIAFDLFVLLGLMAATEEPMTIKELLNTLDHSERGIRYALKWFIQIGLCSLTTHEKDGRRKVVIASDSLVSMALDYERHLLQRFETLRTRP